MVCKLGEVKSLVDAKVKKKKTKTVLFEDYIDNVLWLDLSTSRLHSHPSPDTISAYYTTQPEANKLS